MEETVSRRVQHAMEAVKGTTDVHANGSCNGRIYSNGSNAKREHDLLLESPASPTSQSTASLSSTLSGRDYVLLGVCVGCGFVFGIAAEKAKVHVPSVIQNQMLFQQNTMLKTFLSAVTTSLVTFIILYVLPYTKKLFEQVRVEFGGCVTAKRVVTFMAGGALLGMGMTVSGACPGMVVIQVGAGTDNAMMTLAGCFAGALLYGALEPGLRRHIVNRTHKHFLSSIWMDKLLGTSYVSMAIAVAVLTGGVTLAAEYLVPWRTDSMPVSPPDVALLAQKSWSPIYAGIIMGSLQLPIALAVRDSLGGSSSYCTLISQSRRLSQALPYFNSSRQGVGRWWQVAYWAGAAGGAAMSAVMSGAWGSATGVTPLTAFVGGAMMLFGARLASGCTSGHGLSGLALLSLASFVAVPAMFAGGIGLAIAGKILL